MYINYIHMEIDINIYSLDGETKSNYVTQPLIINVLHWVLRLSSRHRCMASASSLCWFKNTGILGC